MDFSQSTEQRGFADTLARFVADNYTHEGRAAMLAMRHGYDPDCWKRLAELGFVSLAISESNDGLGGSMVDLMLASKAIGSGLVLDPWLPTFIASRLVERLGSDEQKGLWLAGIASGDDVLGFGHIESGGWGPLSSCTLEAHRNGEEYVVDGSKLICLGAGASTAIVSVRTGSRSRDPEGLSLFLVPLDAPGLTMRKFRLVDGSIANALHFENCRLPKTALLGVPGKAFGALELTLAEALVLLSAEAVGIMDAAIAATVEHLKTRQQFGVAIGSFQAIQHRMADCVAQLELANALVTKAAILHDDKSAGRSAKIAASFGAKAFVSQTANLIAEETLQFHGAIGITEELWLGKALKRLLMIAALFGDERSSTNLRNSALSAGDAS